jgi:hypothetical protein
VLLKIIVLALELEDNKGVIRSRKSKDRQYNDLELHDIKGVIRSRKSKKERQYNDHKKENKSSMKIPKR